MAFVYGDRVKETSLSSGTGVMALGGPAVGFQSFAAGVGVGNECFYGIVNTTDDTWEMGRGTIGPGTLTRDTIISSTNSNLIVNFVAGQKIVYTTVPRDFYAAALDTPAHALIDHTVAPFNLMDVATHGTIDHSVGPFNLLPKADLPTEHALIDHKVAPFSLLDAAAHDLIDHKAPPFSLLDDAAHQSINHLAAPYNLMNLAAHAALDHALIPTRPTPQGMGTRTLVMTTDIVLTNTHPADSSKTFQFLDPNGAVRKVTLPAVSTANPAFVIVNTGYYLIRVDDSSGLTIVNIMPWQCAVLAPSGAVWAVASVRDYALPILGQNYNWGGNIAGNDFFKTNGSGAWASGGFNSSDIAGAFHVVQQSGIIDSLSFVKSDTTAIDAYTIWVNDVAVIRAMGLGYDHKTDGGSAYGGTGWARLAEPIQVFAGQRLAIQLDDNGGNEQVVQAMVKNTQAGYMLQWGGDPVADDAYYYLAGIPTQSMNITTPTYEHTAVLIGDGNLVSIAYAIDQQSVGPMELDVTHNGTPINVPLTSGSTENGVYVGIEALGISFSDGDTIAVRGKFQATMGNGNFSILTDVRGMAHQFKGQPSQRTCFVAWRQDTGSGGLQLFDNDALVRVLNRGRVLISWNAQNPPIGGLCVIRNRYESYITNDWTTGNQGTLELPIIVEPGDALAICPVEGGQGRANIFCVIQ